MTSVAKPIFVDQDRLAEEIIRRTGSHIVLALPLGLGKANHVVNALYRRAAEDAQLSLTILTALTLERPRPRSELEKRFLEPLGERFFAGYPPLAYAEGMRDGSLPANVKVHEFFLAPGRWIGNRHAQQNFFAVNYSHVLAYLLRSGFNVLAQLVAPAPGSEQFSLSCNPDLSVDLFDARQQGEIDFLAVGQVNQELPYMTGEAERPAADFDLLLDSEDLHFPLFRTPHEPVSAVDHAIGLQVARLVPDGGTLQVGIGAIGDAVIHGLLLRQRNNEGFCKLLDTLGVDRPNDPLCQTEPFTAGLYAASEMFVEGFLDLIEAGILKREVDGKILHAGFSLGSPLFYEKLAALDDELRAKIAMMPINFINELYGDEDGKRRARTDARFINSSLMTTLLGDVVSDGLENGQVISGVGGQYNFVAMAFALKGARSIITHPATRTSGGKTQSNIRWTYGHTTIPRHLRDLVVTEYGVADLRGKSDADVIAAMLEIADSRFQEELLEQAKTAGKIGSDYMIPLGRHNNLPESLKESLDSAAPDGGLPTFPLGSSYTRDEEKLIVALQELAESSASKAAVAKLAWRGWRRGASGESTQRCLERMCLNHPKSLREYLLRALLQASLP